MNEKDRNRYIGTEQQIYGVEEFRLVGGRGDGMRLLQIRNGKGLEMTVSPDCAADIARLSVFGSNLSYFSPCGYVAPAYYRPAGTGWLKSFTAGFLTTCGLEAVGTPCVDEGEEYALHGSIGNLPADHVYWYEEEEAIIIRALIRDEVIFGRKLRLDRTLRISLTDNSFEIRDMIKNTGDRTEPFEILYHMNMGYPLLDEDSVVEIPAAKVLPRDEHAANDIQNCLSMEKPTPGYTERCYYHQFADKHGFASIFQPKTGRKVSISFDAEKLDGFVEWKMMGVRDYVLGLECGNCYPDGRAVMREKGMLKQLQPGEEICYAVHIKIE